MADRERELRRHSLAASAELVSDPVQRAELESANALRQFDHGLEIIRDYLDPERPFRLRPSHILALHRVALEGLSEFAGLTRPADVRIGQSEHQPPGAHLVHELLEDLCDTINDNWDKQSALHLSGYAMWRLNWIHPFTDGNGRTSRILSYVIMNLRMGAILPGTKTIPDQITENRTPYFQALEAADGTERNGSADLAKMEELLEALLAVQLDSAIDTARST